MKRLTFTNLTKLKKYAVQSEVFNKENYDNEK